MNWHFLGCCCCCQLAGWLVVGIAVDEGDFHIITSFAQATATVCVCVWETLFRAWGSFSGCCGQVQSTRPCCPGSEYSKSFIVVRVRSDFYFLSSKFSECFCRCALAVLVTHTHTVSSNIVLSQPAAETPVRCVSNTNNNIQFLSFWVISFCGIVGIGHYHTRVAQSHGNGMCHCCVDYILRGAPKTSI